MGLIIHTHTSPKFRHSAVFRSEGKLSNPSGSKRNSWAYFPSSFHLIKTRNKNIKPQIHLAFIQLHQEQTEKLIKLTHVTNSRAVTHRSCMARCFLRNPGFQPKQQALHLPLYNKDNVFLSPRFCNVRICTNRDFQF